MKNVMRGLVVILSMCPIILNGQVRQDHCSTPMPESRIPVDVDKMRRERTRSIVLPEVVEVFVHFTTNDAGTLGTVSLDTFMARFQNMKDFFIRITSAFYLWAVRSFKAQTWMIITFSAVARVIMNKVRLSLM